MRRRVFNIYHGCVMDKIFKIVIAIVICVLLIKTCQREVKISSWADVQGQISSYEIEEYRDSSRSKKLNGKVKTKWEDEYRIHFIYTYTVNGMAYTGKFTVDDLDDQLEINSTLHRHPNGKIITIKYDPDYPSDSQYRR